MAEAAATREALAEIVNEDEGTALEDTIRDALEADAAEAGPEPDAEAAKAGDDDKGDNTDTEDEDGDEAGAKKAAAEDADTDTKDTKSPADEADKDAVASQEEGASDDEAKDTEQAKKAEAETSSLEPPVAWSEVDKETFKSQPREAQEFLLKRHGEMEADYTRKTQDIAEVRKTADDFNTVVEPYRPYIASLGVTPAEAFSTLMAAEYVLRNGTPEAKIQKLAQLAKDYGIDGSAIESLEGEDPPNPEIIELRQKLAQLEGQVTTQTRQAQDTINHGTEAQVQTFADEKDAQGNLTHPHFEDVRATMAVHMATTGGDMQAAYDQAVWANPTTRAPLLVADRKKAEEDANARAQKERAAAEAKAKTEKAEKVTKAKRASKGVGPGSESSGAAVEPQAEDLTDEITRVYKAAQSSAQ